MRILITILMSSAVLMLSAQAQQLPDVSPEDRTDEFAPTTAPSVMPGSKEDYTVSIIASDLDHPWSVAFLPSGDYLVALKPGSIVRISAEGDIIEPLTGTPDTYYAGQGGYFDIVLDPDFANNNTVYLSFAYGDGKNNATRVVRAELVGNSFENTAPIYTTNISKDTGAHYGGRLAFMPDGTLVLTTGDGFQYRDAAQDKSNQMGKVVRFTTQGKVPADNPFANEDSAGAQLVYSYGHRNPQGLAIDPNSNIVYQHEHGPKGGDEINIIRAGENYGWPVATHGINYSGALVSPHKNVAGMTDPIVVWTPSIAPSGLAIYRGDMFPEWDGDLLVGALVDQQLVRVSIRDGKATSEEAIVPEIAARVRDVRVAPDGAVYVVTDGPEGALYRIAR